MPEVSIIIPTRKRSQHLLERFRVLERNTPEIFTSQAEVHIAADSDDEATIKLIDEHFPAFKCENLFMPEEIPCNKWNTVASRTDSRWLVTLSDDSLPHPNWLKFALAKITRGFIGLPDGVTGNRNSIFTPLYMATRDWLKCFNGGCLVLPMYKSWYADMETAERAHRSGTYMTSHNSIVEQLHISFGTAPDDEIYQLGATRQIEDFKLYNQRKEAGFPDDFEGVL